MPKLKANESHLIRTAPGRWGAGHIHAEYVLDGMGAVPLCNHRSMRTIYGERFIGSNALIDCKRCLAVTPERMNK